MTTSPVLRNAHIMREGQLSYVRYGHCIRCRGIDSIYASRRMGGWYCLTCWSILLSIGPVVKEEGGGPLVKASDILLRVARVLRHDPEKLTAADVIALRSVGDTLAKHLGYAGLNDYNLLLDASQEKLDKIKEHLEEKDTGGA